METTHSPAQVRRFAVAAPAALPCFRCRIAAGHRRRRRDNAAEREMLAAVTRQLELLDRPPSTELPPPQEAYRYHFDYAGCADLQRMRQAWDHLCSQRAQPRDPVPLAGDYTAQRRGQRQGGAVTMTPSADQVAAFQANGGFCARAVSAVVPALPSPSCCWGVWAMRTAYVGWAETT